MRAFAQADRFVSEVEARKLRPVYVFVGDEVFFRKRCREAILQHLVPSDLRDFSLFEFDLAETDLPEVLDRARTPSLMAPFQVFFIRGVKNLFGRGSNEEKAGRHRGLQQRSQSGCCADFRRRPHQHPGGCPPHGHDRQGALRAHPGNAWDSIARIVELARVEESEAVRWIGEYGATRDVKIDADAARELVDALGGDMMMVSNELEKLILYVGEKKRITLGDVETMVLAAKQRSLYELTDAISAKDRVRALADAGRNSKQRGRRRSRYRAHLHAGEDFPPDAGDSRAQRARPAHAVGGAVARVSASRRLPPTTSSGRPAATNRNAN